MRVLALTVVLAACAALTAPPAARAANYAALQSIASSPGGLTYERARASLPGLQRVTFEKADLNGDGVIDGREWPQLQALYTMTTLNR